MSACLEPFHKAELFLERLAALDVSAESARLFAERAGGRLAARLAGAEAGETPQEPLRPSSPLEWDFSVPGREGRSVGYVSIDAFATPTIGSEKRDWKMLYVGMLYDPRKERTIYRVDYDHEKLCVQLREGARVMGMGSVGQWVAITDGGNGLEQGLRRHFGGETEYVLDFWHAAEHVHGFGKVLYGEGEGARAWSEEGVGVMRCGGGEALLGWLVGKKDEGWKDVVKEEFRKLEGYVRNNEHRMKYPEYRTRGWDIGSGPVEAGCKVMAGRAKGPGMKWHASGCEAIATLRSVFLSAGTLWDAFWQEPVPLAA